jgi:4-hydroxy-L-threonine phosphate dehydrogenase PdxA
MSKPVIAITMGDAAGIGPELIVKVLSDSTVYDRCNPFIVGDLRVMCDTAAILGSAMTFQPLDDLAQARFAPSVVAVLRPAGFELGPVPPADIDPLLGKAAALYLQTAFELALKQQVRGVVSAPMNKASFHLAGYAYFDELAFLADLTNSSETFIDLIVETGAIGTGKPLGQNAAHRAAPAFAFAPGRHGNAGGRMVGGSRSRLATQWARTQACGA